MRKLLLPVVALAVFAASSARADTPTLPPSGSQWSATGYLGFNYSAEHRGLTLDSGEAVLYKLDTWGRWNLSALAAHSNLGKSGVGGALTRSWAIGDSRRWAVTLGLVGVYYGHGDETVGALAGLTGRF